ncbi:universal stress protein [Natronococcus sp. A-GB1]|nr:universal stress protein [Natronococcus sp. A-GB1]MDG5761764.1 universal stress protein [Natronococcus sp. A-GB1]
MLLAEPLPHSNRSSYLAALNSSSSSSSRSAGFGRIRSYPVETEIGARRSEALQYVRLGNHLDRIVMGTRDKTGFERYVLGRVAEKVVPTSPVPVHIGGRDGLRGWGTVGVLSLTIGFPPVCSPAPGKAIPPPNRLIPMRSTAVCRQYRVTSPREPSPSPSASGSFSLSTVTGRSRESRPRSGGLGHRTKGLCVGT